MNYRLIAKTLGTVLFIIAIAMIFPLIVSFIYGGEDAKSFIISIAITLSVSALLLLIKPKNNQIYVRDGMAIVAFSWILVSLLGALPVYLSGTSQSFISAFFESVSAFSGTGASTISNIEACSKGVLFWLALAQWLGGMGVLVLMLALLPAVRGSTLHIMSAEATGPSTEKLVPKIGETAKILYTIYFALSAVQVLILLIGGVNWYDALTVTFSTAGTGGFTTKAASIGSFNSLFVEIVVAIFMLLFGINFSLYFILLTKKSIKEFFKDEELRLFLSVTLFSTLVITIDNIIASIYNFADSLRYSFFQVSSVITSTGFFTANIGEWKDTSQFILLFLMIIGASAGSTGGGTKMIRLLVLIKTVKREFLKIIHPKSVQTIKVNGKAFDNNSLNKIYAYYFAYFLLIGAGTILVSFDTQDFVTTFSAVVQAIGNTGIGLGNVAPGGSFAVFNPFNQMVLSFLMIAGRLEIFPLLLMLTPSFWSKSNM